MLKIDNNFLLTPQNTISASKKLKLKNISINRNHMIELILIDDMGIIITKEINYQATFLITVLTEYIAKSKLWTLNVSMERMMVGLEVILNTEYIEEYIDSSAALSMYITTFLSCSNINLSEYGVLHTVSRLSINGRSYHGS